MQQYWLDEIDIYLSVFTSSIKVRTRKGAPGLFEGRADMLATHGVSLEDGDSRTILAENAPAENVRSVVEACMFNE